MIAGPLAWKKNGKFELIGVVSFGAIHPMFPPTSDTSNSNFAFRRHCIADYIIVVITGTEIIVVDTFDFSLLSFLECTSLAPTVYGKVQHVLPWIKDVMKGDARAKYREAISHISSSTKGSLGISPCVLSLTFALVQNILHAGI